MDAFRKRVLIPIATAALGLALSGCGGGGGSSSEGGSDPGGGDAAPANNVQKGPFQPGGTVTLTRLNGDGTQSGDTASTEIGTDGGFTFPETGWTGPTVITATGTFFNESTGTFSSEEMTLSALVTLPVKTNANINLYTHLVAATTRELMAITNGDFDEIRTTVREVLSQALGIDGTPVDLDLLRAANNAEQADGANLLLFSAAFLQAGLKQDDLQALIEDFTDDGLFGNGVGESQWRAILQAIHDHPDLQSDAALALQNQYSSQPPSSDNTEGFHWLPGACETALFEQPRVVCENLHFHGDYENDSGEPITFIPAVSGRYSIEVVGDDSQGDANTATCSWRVSQGSSVLGDSSHINDVCGMTDITGGSLVAGEEYAITPQISRNDNTAPAHFTLAVRRNGDGYPPNPMPLTHFPYRGHVMTWKPGSGAPASYFTFQVDENATHTITLSDYPCGSGYLRADLYAPPADASLVFAHTHHVVASDEDTCSQTIETPLEAGRDYYLKVSNLTSRTTPDRPAPDTVRFRLNIEH